MLNAIFRSMRLRQWVKNGLLFAGLVFDRQLNNWPAVLTVLQGFLAYGLVSSGVYLMNDLIDIKQDRAHPKKRLRPIAAGELPIPIARWTAAILILAGLGLGFILSPEFASIAFFALVLNLAYSLKLKHIPIVDVIVLAGFYVIRVAAGVALVSVDRFSPWLYVFTTFAALFMGVGKRRAEINMADHNAGKTRKVLAGYTSDFLDQLLLAVLTLAILTYSLYTFSAPNLPENHSMMLTIPFVIYGFFRYLYLVQVEKSGEAPEEILYQDRPIQYTLLLWGLAVLIIFYIFTGA
jgi:4-hydroxybenzoate polyprenyltransferase